jgi:tetratricopeptide (TPR) repeat protein
MSRSLLRFKRCLTLLFTLPWLALAASEEKEPAGHSAPAEATETKPAEPPSHTPDTNPPSHAAVVVPAEIDPALRESRAQLATDNLTSTTTAETGNPRDPQAQRILDAARQQRRDKQVDLAQSNLVGLIESNVSEDLKRGARLELAMLLQDQGELARAQQLYAQYLKLYPDDPNEPEVTLRQGLIYRQMGAPTLAIAKFYGVMSTALNVKTERVEYYRRLVLQAQTEIAETYYLQGKYGEAVDFFSRLLKLNDKDLNDALVRAKLVRSLAKLNRPADAISQADIFLSRYADSKEAPEIRYLLADSLRKVGRAHEAVQQVLLLLQNAQAESAKNPSEWAQWQRRTGNDVANQLYNQGDYLNALEIYNRLLELDHSPEWELPVWYQLGLVYERLEQPQKALDAYGHITARVGELKPENTTPNLKTIAELAQWRVEHLQWLLKAELSRHQLIPANLDGTEKAGVTAVK